MGKKGQIPYIRTKKHRKNMAKIFKDRKRPPFSVKWRKNLGKASKGKKRPPFSNKWIKNLCKANKGKSNPNYGKHPSVETIKKIREGIKKHYDKTGRVSLIATKIRVSPKYRQWHQDVFIRDDFTCQNCKVKGGYLHAHHKDKSFSQLLNEIKMNLPLLDLYSGAIIYSPLWDLKNGITLCLKCHKELHKKIGRKNA